MKKLSKTALYAMIAGAAAVILAGVLVILLVTAPGEEEPEPVPAEVNVQITNREADSVLKLTVTNEHGSFTFDRRLDPSISEETGGITKNYYWTSGELMGVGQDDSIVKNFITNAASLLVELVEENVSDFGKYGLDSPRTVISITFDDNTKTELCFGSATAASASGVYCREKDGNTVYSAYAVPQAFGDIKQFANLLITQNAKEGHVDYVAVERKDLDEIVEIRFMDDIDAARKDDNYVVSTKNTYRYVSPIRFEFDSLHGEQLYQDTVSITMEECAFLEKSEENMSKCGLSDPFCRVRFGYDGEDRILLLGNAVREKLTAPAADNTGAITRVSGYYAALEGVPGIFVIAADKAPWYDFDYREYITSRPLAPYIFGCENVEVTVPGGTYKFDIDAENKKFLYNGAELDDKNFRSFYQTLTDSVGEEIYFGEYAGEPYVSVVFNYGEDYAKLYGVSSDKIEYFRGDRKITAAVNGLVVYKTRASYAETLCENVRRLISGESVETDW